MTPAFSRSLTLQRIKTSPSHARLHKVVDEVEVTDLSSNAAVPTLSTVLPKDLHRSNGLNLSTLPRSSSEPKNDQSTFTPNPEQIETVLTKFTSIMRTFDGSYIELRCHYCGGNSLKNGTDHEEKFRFILGEDSPTSALVFGTSKGPRFAGLR